MSQQIGFAVEKQARELLTQQGLSFVMSNYRCRWGELDLIMRDKEYVVFIEVRARVSAEYGNALESITINKQQKIIKSASHFLLTHAHFNRFPARFDVVYSQGRQSLQWIKDAFSGN